MSAIFTSVQSSRGYQLSLSAVFTHSPMPLSMIELSSFIMFFSPPDASCHQRRLDNPSGQLACNLPDPENLNQYSLTHRQFQVPTLRVETRYYPFYPCMHANTVTFWWQPLLFRTLTKLGLWRLNLFIRGPCTCPVFQLFVSIFFLLQL